MATDKCCGNKLKPERFVDFGLQLKGREWRSLPWQPAPRTKTASSLRVEKQDGCVVCEQLCHL